MKENPISRGILNPQTIALVGVSSDPNKNTGRPLRFLKSHGFSGEVVPINPNRREVQGISAYPCLQDAPNQIDHAFIMVPSHQILSVIADCIAAKVPLATIYSDGFAEQGRNGAELQAEMVHLARKGNLRLIGPNSMGVIDTRAGLTLTISAFLEQSELKPGRIGVISQSGSVIGTMLSRGGARGISYSSLVSIGNECDITVGELVGLMVDDPQTDILLLFLEAIRDPKSLAINARRAFAAGKPIIAYKLGRSKIGRELALSHSGAIAGPDASADAFFRHHGIIRADMLETLLELPPLIIKARPTPTRRIAVLTTTGGGAGMVVDRLGTYGIELVPPSPALRTKMKEFNINLGHRRVIDLTMAGTATGVYGAALEVLLQEPNLDAVLAVVGSSAQFHPEVAVQPIINVPKTGMPLAVFLVPQADASLDMLQKAGIAAFRTPESCADGVRALMDWHTPTEKVKTKNLDAAMHLIKQTKGHILKESEAADIFAAIGVPMTPSVKLANPYAKIDLDLDFPLAAKVLSADLPHKTEAGAVALNITDLESLRTQAITIWESALHFNPEARLDGILIQPMVFGLAEALVGFRRDPETGPIVILSTGGVLAEIYSDAAIRLAPVNLTQAREMIDEVRGLAPIRGYRNLPKGDLKALAECITTVSQFAAIEEPIILEAEINPLSVAKDGCGVIAVDALIRLAS